MLLNHVVVGILLLPLGAITFLASVPAGAGAAAAIMVARISALAVTALPIALFGLMGIRYFEAPAFVIATVIVCLASISMLAAAFWPAQNAGT